MATQEIAKQAVKGANIVTVETYLKENDKLIRQALQNTITPERFLAVVMMIIKSPALSGCSQKSLIAAVIQTIQIGLTPGPIGHVYFVPFYNKGVLEAQTIIGYRGLAELINRSGDASILSSFVVYEKDQFQYELGLTPILRHIPGSGDRGDKVGVYCIAKNNIAGEKVFIYLQKEEVLKVKDESLSKIPEDKRKYSPWVKWEESMWQKTAVRRIAKLLPLSVETQQKIEVDESIKTNIAPKMIDEPDKADWAGDTIEAEAKVDNPKTKPEAEVKKDSPIKTLEEAVAGDTILEFTGEVTKAESQPTKKSKITTYHVVNDEGREFKIQKWGAIHEGSEKALCTFFNIVVKEFNGSLSYLASDIKVEL